MMDESRMRLALDEGRGALRRGEVPVGCVFFDLASGAVLCAGSNDTTASSNVCTRRSAPCDKIDGKQPNGCWRVI